MEGLSVYILTNTKQECADKLILWGLKHWLEVFFKFYSVNPLTTTNFILKIMLLNKELEQSSQYWLSKLRHHLLGI